MRQVEEGTAIIGAGLGNWRRSAWLPSPSQAERTDFRRLALISESGIFGTLSACEGRVNFSVTLDDPADDSHVVYFSGENGKRFDDNSCECRRFI
jgi:hypothetical protein